MSEKSAIEKSPAPRTRASLAADLIQLGVKPGMVLLVHSAMSKLGWVNGGPVAVIQALQDVLTPQGTLVMPTHSGALSDPANWSNPPVPASWVQTVRDTMPAFDPRLTPTRGMGAIPELFRTWPDVLRSNHPSCSFAAWGYHARSITADHRLQYSLGESSPLARVYDWNGSVLLMGVGYGNNTSFHLAEYRVPHPPKITAGAPMVQKGKRVWTTFDDVAIDEEDFPLIGLAFEKSFHVATGNVGSAKCRLFSQKTAVDFAVSWMKANRNN